MQSGGYCWEKDDGWQACGNQQSVHDIVNAYREVSKVEYNSNGRDVL